MEKKDNYTPGDILNYVVEEKMESDFMVALTSHKMNYSIGEIVDRQFEKRGGGFHLCSASYRLDLPIEDEDIVTALGNGLYVSPFVERYGERYRIHFLVHPYPVFMKERFDEEILAEVIRYMIGKTILALRLDTPEKVMEYIGKKKER